MDRDQIRLVKGAMSGDKEAFEKLIGLRRADILYFAISLSNQHDGEDIAQEAILYIYRDISNLRDPEKFDSWMFTIVRHVSINMMTKIKKVQRATVSMDVLDDTLANELVEDRREFLPDEYFESKEKRKIVMDVIETLPDNYKESLLLYYYQGMSYKEIAEVLETNQKKVANDLTRARALIKSRVEGKTKETLLYSIPPVGAIPILTQIFKADAAAKITPDMCAHVMEGISTQILNIPSSQSLASNVGIHGTIAKVAIIGTITILTAAGITFGMHLSKELPTVYEEPPMVSETSTSETSESTQSTSEKPVITLTDMIGEEFETELLSFERGTVDEALWKTFLTNIGATLEEEANEQDDILYRMYLLQKQDKQLVLMEKKDLISGELTVMHQFGNNTGILPYMFEVILLFDE